MLYANPRPNKATGAKALHTYIRIALFGKVLYHVMAPRRYEANHASYTRIVFSLETLRVFMRACISISAYIQIGYAYYKSQPDSSMALARFQLKAI